MAIWGIVPAAGAGVRLGAEIPKQYLELSGKTILDCTLSRLVMIPQIQHITVMLGATDELWSTCQMAQHPLVKTAIGGESRCESVFNGLTSLAQVAAADDWVLVHDAVRPCVRIADINGLLRAIENHAVGGLLASPVEHTLKRGGEDLASGSESLATLDRGNLWYAYTPQVFRYGKLITALAESLRRDTPVTDEASALEAQGERPLLVRGSTDNIKITLSSDLSVAELILKNQLNKEHT